jgi:UPF0042 nucleotide-binding protein
MRDLRGDQAAVAADIEGGPRFAEAYAKLRKRVSQHSGTVWLGCTGGHHRSVYLAERLSRELGCNVRHLNYSNP